MSNKMDHEDSPSGRDDLQNNDTQSVNLDWKMPEDIDLQLIDPSPFQPRKHFDEDRLEELTESFRKHGQLDDALVRTRPGGRFELIAGARRSIAALRAGWNTLRCKVRDMSDVDAHEIVLIEQLQHEQFSVIEEASGYRSLLALQTDGQKLYTITKIADRIGRKETHIREFLSILEAPADVQQAVDEGRLSKKAAAALGCIPDEAARREASNMVMHPMDSAAPLSAVKAMELIRDRFVRSLQTAPFELTDEKLVPVEHHGAAAQFPGARVMGGACTDCPYRSGMMPALTDMLARPAQTRQADGALKGRTSGVSAQLCTKPHCYALKCAAVTQRIKDAAVKKGCNIMDGETAEKLFDPDHGGLRDNVDYVALDAKPDPALCNHFNEEKMETWRALIKKHSKGKVQVYLAENPETHEMVEIVKCQDAIKAINAATKGKVFTGVADDEEADAASGTDALQGTDEMPRQIAILRMVREKLHTAMFGGDGNKAKDAVRLFFNDISTKLLNDEARSLLVDTFDGDATAPTLEEAIRAVGFTDYSTATTMAFLAACMVQWGLTWQGWERWEELLGMNFDKIIIVPTARKSTKATKKELKTVSRSKAVKRNQSAVNNEQRSAMEKPKKLSKADRIKAALKKPVTTTKAAKPKKKKGRK